MNGGVGDAIDLSWKLAATLQGWGAPGLRASYEIERQMGAGNDAASRFCRTRQPRVAGSLSPQYPRSYPGGRRDSGHARAIGQRGAAKSKEMIGAELGYRYVGSPVIWPEPADGPEHNLMAYVPTTWPGARLPHVWLAD